MYKIVLILRSWVVGPVLGLEIENAKKNEKGRDHATEKEIASVVEAEIEGVPDLGTENDRDLKRQNGNENGQLFNRIFHIIHFLFSVLLK